MGNHAHASHYFFKDFQESYEASAIYRVHTGDTLSDIIRRYYHISINDARFPRALLRIQRMNNLNNPDLIHTGQLLRLPPMTSPHKPIAHCSIDDDIPLYDQFSPEISKIDNLMLKGPFTGAQTLERLSAALPANENERDLFMILSWLHHNYDYLSLSAGAGFNTWGNLVAQGNQQFIAEVKSAYQQYKAGTLTKSQYDYRRRLALKKFSKSVGPFEKFLMKGNTTAEAIRISKVKTLPPTAKIDFHLGRLSKMAKIAKNGGLLLTAAGGVMGCYNMAQTDSKHQKNEIFVETVTSSGIGLASSLALSLVLYSNPVGWGVALVLGVGTAVGSYAAGKGAVKFYNRHYQEVDLATLSGANGLCQ